MKKQLIAPLNILERGYKFAYYVILVGKTCIRQFCIQFMLDRNSEHEV